MIRRAGCCVVEMGYEATASRAGTQAVFEIRGKQRDVAAWAGARLPPLPAQPNTETREDGLAICHCGPDRWLVRAPIRREAGLTEALDPDAAPVSVSVVPVSDSYAFFNVSGKDADAVMSMVTPLDLHRSVFPENAATFTAVCGVRGFLARRTRPENGYELAVDASLAEMVECWFARILG